MQHSLADSNGPMVLELTSTSGRMLHHPLDAALASGAPMPAPTPFPQGPGHALAHADMGMYVLVATPLVGEPTMDDLGYLVDQDPGAVGMARIQVRADEAAREAYAEPAPLQKHAHSDLSGGPDELDRMLAAEKDDALRHGLQFMLGRPKS
ncbi:hypothetical protein P3T27_007953 [Kitasatospora sp. MAA19]|uniref:hypothetical protein n=1 Tax=unclassified Kitasatospora TaxID=2633591 RepID=UPI0024772CEE|nr:hypothetical protein [Kitasatospora sp. MAA19]MDH6711200.1 hypothetical protein [Kitasatospora sp. MAA19]